MSPRTKAAIFIAIALAWFGLAAVSLAAGNWLVALVDVLAGSVMVFFAYRATHPPLGPHGEIKPLRAPRPPR